jgi:hypothetical protein
MIELGARSSTTVRGHGSIALVARLGLLIGVAGILLAPASALGSASAAPVAAAPVAAAPNPAPAMLAGVGTQSPNLAAADLPEWTGGVDFYRDGVFTTQASWLYCTAADIQIIRNMVEGTTDHSGPAQTQYFDWMRTQNQYDMPLSAGIDPAGWAAGMGHFVDDRYELVSTTSFGYSLQLAVTRMRLTGLPVAITVAHGNHGWVLNGFTATADPAVTADFAITSLSMTGPLWGLQSQGGYDMPPNTSLTVDQLATFFTRWHYDPIPMIWDGTFVSIQPVPEGSSPAPVPTPVPTPPPTPKPTPKPAPRPTAPPPPTPTAAPTLSPTPAPTPGPTTDATPAATATPASTALTAAVVTERPGATEPEVAQAGDPTPGSTLGLAALAAAVAAAAASAAAAVVVTIRRRNRSRPG